MAIVDRKTTGFLRPGWSGCSGLRRSSSRAADQGPTDAQHFGDPGQPPGVGASVEFNIKEEPITMLSISGTGGGGFKLIIAEGESVRGPIPPAGNTNTHGLFLPDVRTFLKRWVAEGPTHHFALGIGHHGDAIRRLAGVLGVEAALVDNR